MWLTTLEQAKRHSKQRGRNVKEGTKRVLVYGWNHQLHKFYVILCSYGEEVVAIAVGPTAYIKVRLSSYHGRMLQYDIVFTLYCYEYCE